MRAARTAALIAMLQARANALQTSDPSTLNAASGNSIAAKGKGHIPVRL